MMGNHMRYLSKPITDCNFENGAGKFCNYTAASMQGWRKCQEDRFVCIPDFYNGCSFFGVYDGHGGSEIAEFLKQRLHYEVMHSLQMEDDIELALHLGFLACDASILEPANIAELNDMVEEESQGTVVQILKNQKALEEAMARAYEDQTRAGQAHEDQTRAGQAHEDQSRAGQAHEDQSRAGQAHEDQSRADQDREDQSRADQASDDDDDDSIPVYPQLPRQDRARAGPSLMNTFRLYNDRNTSGMQVFYINSDPGPTEESIKAALREAGHVFYEDERREALRSEERMEVERPLEYLLSDDIEPSDPEDGDYNIEEDEESSSTESEEETNCITGDEILNSEPGYLSGSTATVAVIQKNRIYVANVGDSRCVLSRNGQAIDMSLDHKPDDPEERARIIGAGGSVSEDGRVDNCLNLSRAFGDFKFKGDTLVPSQQSITAEPFIRSLDIERDDDFLIIASDGIWNSMSSQEVVDYINIRLRAGDDLKDICEELFNFNLASNKDNDGTGCDNMSCIVIRFGNQGESVIDKSLASNEVLSSDDTLKQEGKIVNAPASGSDEQMATDIPEETSADEKNFHQNSQDSLLVAQSPKSPFSI